MIMLTRMAIQVRLWQICQSFHSRHEIKRDVVSLNDVFSRMFLGATARHFNVSNEVTLLLHHCPVDWHNWEAAQKSFEQSFHWVCEPLFEFLSWQPAIFCNTCILIYHGKISQHLSCYINAVCSIFKKLLNEEAGTLQSRFAGRSRTFCNSASKLSGSHEFLDKKSWKLKLCLEILKENQQR